VKDQSDAVRVDRWLWAARFYRSRSLAAQACDGGKVEVNSGSAKPHKLVRIGDLIDLTLSGERRRVKVRELSERRGPASVARSLYDDLTPPKPVEERGGGQRGGARPTKRQRRQMDRFRGW